MGFKSPDKNIWLKEPKPQKVDGQFNYSNYVADQEYFWLRLILHDNDGNMITVKNLIEKND